MKNEIDVSVIIPAYNSECFIKQTIQSVLSQEGSTIEIIVVDDGSTDRTKDILTPFFDRIKYIYKENGGVSSARNAGISLAKGKWVAFLDSDDMWRANHLNKLLARTVDMPDVALVYGGTCWVDADGQLMEDFFGQEMYPEGWIFLDLLEHNYIRTSSVIVRKEVLDTVGPFNTESCFRNGEDIDLWLRIASSYPVAAAPEAIILYRRHADNLTHGSLPKVVGHLAALDNAITLWKNGGVNRANICDDSQIKAIMREKYRRAVIGLFCLDQFNEVRRIGTKGLLAGYGSIALLVRVGISCLPQFFVKMMKLTYRKLYGPDEES